MSWVRYGDRLMEFPTSLLGIAMGTLLLPSLSQANASGNTQRYSDLLDWGLRLALLLATPAMVGLSLASLTQDDGMPLMTIPQALLVGLGLNALLYGLVPGVLRWWHWWQSTEIRHCW